MPFFNKEKIEEVLSKIEMCTRMDDCRIIVSTDVGDKIMTKEERIFYEKEKFVKSVHTTKGGKLKTINEPDIRATDLNRFWNTLLPDKKRCTASTYEGLIEKLFVYYTAGEYIADYSVSEIWKKALEDYSNAKYRPEKTIIEQEKTYKRFISPEFACQDIRKINEAYIMKYIREFLIREMKNNTPVKEKAFNNFKSMLNILFGYAVDKKLLPSNPSKKATTSFFAELLDYNTKKRRRSDVMHSSKEYELIFAEADRLANIPKHKDYYVYDTMMRVHYLTGVRPAELVALKWKNIEPAQHILWVCEQQRLIPSTSNSSHSRRYEIIGFTKNEKGISKGGRPIPISNQLQQLFDKMKLLQEAHGINSEFIFCDKSGDMIKKDNYMDCLGSICRRLNIDRHGTYTFRRAANCRFYENDIDAFTRGKLLGNSLGVNTSCYTFEKEDYLDQARDVMDIVSF